MLKELQRILFNFKGHQSAGAAQEEILTLFKNHIKDKMPGKKKLPEPNYDGVYELAEGFNQALEKTTDNLLKDLE